MSDFEVHISLPAGTRLIGRARSNRARGKEIDRMASAFEHEAHRQALALG